MLKQGFSLLKSPQYMRKVDSSRIDDYEKRDLTKQKELLNEVETPRCTTMEEMFDEDVLNPFLWAYMITSDKLGVEHADSYIQVTENDLRVYAKDGPLNMKLKLVFKGLGIRSVYDMHEQYMYTICDDVQISHKVIEFPDKGEP